VGRPRLDLTGEKIGLLTIVGANGVSRNGHSLWDCICECGKWLIVTGTDLNNFNSRSCRRCSKLKDITGERFGVLTAVDRVDKDKNGMSKWLCKCDCGNITVVAINHLTSGHCPVNSFTKKDWHCEGMTADNQTFIFSLKDWDKVTSYNWHIDAKGYVVTQVDRNISKLHHLILRPYDGLQIDHINRNKKDCRRSNLRFASNRENAANKSVYRNNFSTGHKNVYLTSNKYRVVISKNGVAHHFGYFDNIKEAIQIANRARQELFGEFAFEDSDKNLIIDI